SLDIIAESGCFLEVNTGAIARHGKNSPYPSWGILNNALERNIPIVIDSDAHRPEQINGYFKEAVDILRKMGFDKHMILTEKGWEEQSL
ncbi:MAG: histidinol phosphate phosphatase, partial [Candidatus Aenigmatarchaeota archaeon]